MSKVRVFISHTDSADKRLEKESKIVIHVHTPQIRDTIDIAKYYTRAQRAKLKAYTHSTNS